MKTHAMGHNPLDIDCRLVTDLVTRFIRNEVKKTGMTKAVLGLSGGIDSALVALLCKEALGADNVCGARLPYRSSSPESLAHAELVAKKAGIRMLTCDISAAADGFAAAEFTLDTPCDGFLPFAVKGGGAEAGKVRLESTLSKHHLGNILARVRMNALYHISAISGAMVVGTSNKTELLLGYGTLWGDLAYGINPVGDLYKHQVRQLARYHGVPEEIISKKPSADLFPGQTDEGDLGFSYEQLDNALYRLVDARENPRLLVENGELSAELVNFCLKKIITMQYKRQMPHIAVVSFRAINQSFNYPRDWAL